jgi:hypothetical protein
MENGSIHYISKTFPSEKKINFITKKWEKIVGNKVEIGSFYIINFMGLIYLYLNSK